MGRANCARLYIVVPREILTNLGESIKTDLIRSAVFDYFGAEIGALYGAQILLVRLSVARILVQHVRRPRLYL